MMMEKPHNVSFLMVHALLARVCVRKCAHILSTGRKMCWETLCFITKPEKKVSVRHLQKLIGVKL